MNKTEILQKLVPLVAKSLSVEDAEVTPTATLQELGADSLDYAQTVMDIETEFNIGIPDTDMEKFTNIQSIVDYIAIHTSEPTPTPAAE